MSGFATLFTPFGGPAGSVTGVGGIASAQNFGIPNVVRTPPALGLLPSNTLYPDPNLLPQGPTGVANIAPASIPSAQAFGVLQIIVGAKAVTDVGGIPSAEAFGTASVGTTLSGVGAIGSSEVFGTPTMLRSVTGVGAIGSAEAFGTPTIGIGAFFVVAGVGNIATAEAFGTLKLNLIIRLTGIPSAMAFGSTITQGIIQVRRSVYPTGGVEQNITDTGGAPTEFNTNGVESFHLTGNPTMPGTRVTAAFITEPSTSGLPAADDEQRTGGVDEYVTGGIEI